MDPDYIDDEYGDYFFDDEWLYIEDQVAFADELAETQIASPGYSGVNAEIQIESYEYDTYEYFGELEYGSDAYWDVLTKATTKPVSTSPSKRGTSKRKRASTSTSIRTDKRRKVNDDVALNVVYRQVDNPRQLETVQDDSITYALLPDWRERFPANMEISWNGIMPADMQAAASAHKTDLAPGDGDTSLPVDNSALKENEPPPTSERGEEAEKGPMQIDADTLRSILQSKLGSAGIDQEGFMAVIQDMLADGGSAEEAIAQLAASLLDQSGEDGAALDWLQDQGVGIEKDGKDDVMKDAPEPKRSRSRRK